MIGKTIHLKTGAKGKIIGYKIMPDGNEKFQVEFKDGFNMTYFKDEIARIGK